MRTPQFSLDLVWTTPTPWVEIEPPLPEHAVYAWIMIEPTADPGGYLCHYFGKSRAFPDRITDYRPLGTVPGILLTYVPVTPEIAAVVQASAAHAGASLPTARNAAGYLERILLRQYRARHGPSGTAKPGWTPSRPGNPASRSSRSVRSQPRCCGAIGCEIWSARQKP